MSRRIVPALACAAACAGAAAAPSQNPLLTAEGVGAPPNIVLTVDDSRSMMRRFIPDGLFPGYRSGAGVTAGQLAFHPADGPGAGIRAPATASTPAPAAVVTTREGDLFSSRLRSAGVNRLYYDPEVRYRPWSKADGTLLPDADPQAAWLDPLAGGSVAAGTAVQLVGEQSWSTALWCRSNASGTASPICGALAGESLAPATYYEWSGASPDAAASFRRVRIMDFANFTRGPARTDCSVTVAIATCTQAQEYQNFANWFTYHRTRLYAAIAATSAAFSALGDSFRLGYGRLSKPAGAVDGISTRTVERGVRPFSGAGRDAFFSWLHRLSAAGGAPMRQAMDDVGQYYSRADAQSPWGEPPAALSPPLQAACRRSHHVLVTDGTWNGAGPTPVAFQNVDAIAGPAIDGPASPTRRHFQYTPTPPFSDTQGGTLADIAMDYFKRDLRPDLANTVPVTEAGPATAGRNVAFWQNVVTHTVAFGVGGTLDPAVDLPALTSGQKAWPMVAAGGPATVDDLWHAALNGGGFHANLRNPSQFAAALGQIFEGAGPAEANQAGVEMSGRSPGTAMRKYVATYRAARWSGELTAYAVDGEGVQGAVLWRASEGVPQPALRNIWVGRNAGNGQGAVPFRWADMQAAGVAPLLGGGATAALVDYLRGDRSGETTGAAVPYRVRDGVLGDIVNSQPVLVRGLVDLQYSFLPAGTPGRDTYRAFLEQKAARAGVVFFGANDGMLHAMNEADGRETFAFVPASVLAHMASLAAPTYAHRYLVDGPVAESDAYWDGRWHNVLLATTGAGPAAVFALDVTRSTALDGGSVLWEFNAGRDPELGSVLSAPESGVTRGGQWVAVFGNGYGGASGRARLYVLDMKTGAVVRTLDTGAGPANGLGGVRLVRDAANRVVAAYAGDLKGNVWRFDLSAADSAKWAVGFGGKPLFTAVDGAGQPQPITAAPDHVPHPKGGNIVLAGSGRLFEDADVFVAQPQALFGLWDRTAGDADSAGGRRILATAELATHKLATVAVAQGLSRATENFDTVVAQPVDWSIHSGWKLPLPPGFRDIYGASLAQGFARFQLVAPAMRGNACALTPPQGIDLQLNPRTGAMPGAPVFDTNGDGVVNGADTPVAGIRGSAQGRRIVLVNARTGGARIADSSARPVAIDYGRPRLPRAWRQIINFPR